MMLTVDDYYDLYLKGKCVPEIRKAKKNNGEPEK